MIKPPADLVKIAQLICNELRVLQDEAMTESERPRNQEDHVLLNGILERQAKFRAVKILQIIKEQLI